jgi:hypothetical protein
MIITRRPEADTLTTAWLLVIGRVTTWMPLEGLSCTGSGRLSSFITSVAQMPAQLTVTAAVTVKGWPVSRSRASTPTTFSPSIFRPTTRA